MFNPALRMGDRKQFRISSIFPIHTQPHLSITYLNYNKMVSNLHLFEVTRMGNLRVKGKREGEWKREWKRREGKLYF